MVKLLNRADVHTERPTIRFGPDEDDLGTVLTEAPANACIIGHKETEVTIQPIEIATNRLVIEHLKLKRDGSYTTDTGKELLDLTGENCIVRDCEIDVNDPNNGDNYIPAIGLWSDGCKGTPSGTASS